MPMERMDTEMEMGDTVRSDTSSTGGPGLGRLFPFMAWAALVSALLAVAMGGVVRVTGSGLGCPDWPLCRGQVIPPWEIAPWIEYIHRLSAAVAGVFTFLMVATGVRRFGLKGRLTPLVLVAGVLLVTQAILGAFTVLSELSPGIALIHMAIATGLVGLLAVIVSAIARPIAENADGPLTQKLDRFRTLVVALAVVSFLAILSGAYVTRSGAAAACLDIPFCGMPVGDMVDLQWFNLAHRGIVLVAAGLTVTVLAQAVNLAHRPIMLAATLLIGLLTLQVLVGIGMVLLQLPTGLRAMHVATPLVFFAVLMFLLGGLWRASLTGERPDVARPSGQVAPGGAFR